VRETFLCGLWSNESKSSFQAGQRMKLSHFIGIFVVLGCLVAACVAATPQTPTNSSPPVTSSVVTQQKAVLPPTFGGWAMQGSAQVSTDPKLADPTNEEVLKEFRFVDVSSATYTREDGRTLKIRAARFADATGAFGAYTFYLEPQMNKEQIGDQAASLGKRVLFYRGDVLVDAQFSQESVMSVAQLRELAGLLPRPAGGAANLPTFIQFLPHRGYVANTQKYATGPAALSALSAPVSANQVDFGSSSEVTLARYDTPSGEATLMLISYPTPQMAAEHLKKIDPAHQQQGQPQGGVTTIGNAGNFFYKRTGPIIAIASGPASDSDAKTLLGLVNWEANVTWNEATDSHEVRDLYQLILNIVVLCAILAGLAIIAGVAFGGLRILMKRLYPNKVFDRPEQMEFISLHLTDTASQSGTETRHPSS
jgi:uncharacterized protein DUF6599